MALDDVALGDPHVDAHNAERHFANDTRADVDSLMADHVGVADLGGYATAAQLAAKADASALAAKADTSAMTAADALRARHNLPSYAPAASLNFYDPLLNIYNKKGSNSRHAHAGIMKVLNGGKMNILGFGDSVNIGFDGTDCRDWRSIPNLVGRLMCQALGVAEAGGMFPLASGPSTYPIDKVAKTGTVLFGSGCATLSSGATMTITPKRAGDIFELYYGDLSTPFTVNIDGTGPVTVTPTNTSTVKRYRVTGLTDGLHSIVVTALSNYAFVNFAAIQRSNGAGIQVDNISWGGAKASSGGPSNAWLDTSVAANVQANRKGCFDIQAIAPDLIVSSLGGNDGASGITGDSFASDFATIKGWYPNSTWIHLLSCGLSTTTQSTWDAFCTRMYKMADDLDITMLDLRDRVGWCTEANSLGYIGADGYHEKQGGMFDWARAIASAYLGSTPGSFFATPASSYAVTDLADGSVVGEF